MDQILLYSVTWKLLISQVSPLILNDGTYKSYIKPNNKIKYIHKSPNHPPSAIRRIPLFIESRLSTISFNEKIFPGAIPPYQNALQNSGYRLYSYINVLKTCHIAGYKQKCYLGSCETTFKNRFCNHKSRSITLTIKIIWNYQKSFRKSKSAMEQQKILGKLSEYAFVTTQTVSAVFCV